MKGKLTPRYIGPFEIWERFGPMASRLRLPRYLERIHNIFNMSLLRKVEINPSRLLPQVSIDIREDLTVEVKLVKILDRSDKESTNKKVPLIKILWRNS
jgi:hypothetical protein